MTSAVFYFSNARHVGVLESFNIVEMSNILKGKRRILTAIDSNIVNPTSSVEVEKKIIEKIRRRRCLVHSGSSENIASLKPVPTRMVTRSRAVKLQNQMAVIEEDDILPNSDSENSADELQRDDSIISPM